MFIQPTGKSGCSRKNKNRLGTPSHGVRKHKDHWRNDRSMLLRSYNVSHPTISRPDEPNE